jgi:NAD(P)-dependent dehydrogenase (short-subunit alcohol dehydrogenase family)
VELNLDTHTAIVTGSHRGTGQIIAKALLDEGAVVLGWRHPHHRRHHYGRRC